MVFAGRLQILADSQEIHIGGALVVQSEVVNGDALPSYDLADRRKADKTPKPKPSREDDAGGKSNQDHKRRRIALGVAGIGVGVGAGAMYAAAWTARENYVKAVVAADAPGALAAHRLTNGLSIGAVVAGSASASLLIVGIAL